MRVGLRISKNINTSKYLKLSFLSLVFVSLGMGLTSLYVGAVGSYDNANIARIALLKKGQNGGECKQFVNNIVYEASGHAQMPAPGYHDGFMRAGGVNVSSENARTGDIIQIGNSDSASPLHTAIIVTNNGENSFTVVDSNWGLDASGNPDHKVREHTFNPYTWAAGSDIRIWRMGTVSGGEGSPAVSSQLGSNGVNHVFTANSSGVIYDISWGNGAPLTTWSVANLGSAVTSLSSLVSSGVTHVFAATTNGAVYDISWGNGSPLTVWQVWSNGQNGNVISSMVSGGVIHVLAGTPLGTLNDISWGNGAPLTTWQIANVGSPVRSLSSQTSNGVVHILSATNAGEINDTSWGNGESLTTWQVWSNGQNGNVISSMVRDGTLHVITGTAAGTLYDTSWGNGAPLTTWQVK